ncbi:MAG: tripartite tricarboxylate transporter TctB family protein [Desulfarculaceae bacterium]|nr:tripartite tricarboxylate transporter TctB family protein [Desulfarculaceae bacterium]MCF8049173.1 tripartite tricarboxylate transporter TctB family protein [Desulfarculaceae bacterium]MCF8065420.1 tripartite tricarboxylate transporter TctB family protein [Desulfarculaceae bacterium]MCF8096707.1 tripartite tricarboxylate transporter TctB family protein [Desulfarculaceae bacterium]
MRKLNLKVLSLVLLILATAMLASLDILGFRGAVAGTIGPGVYPLITLGLMLLTGLIIIFRAFSLIKYSLFSPFGSSDLRGLAVARLAQVIGRELGEKVNVTSGVGQGYFSSFFAGSRAKPDGHNFVILDGSGPTPSPFSNAAECLERFVPVMRLSDNPYFLLGPTTGAASGALDLPALLFSGPLGFSAQPEEVAFFCRAISLRTGVSLESRTFASTPRALHALAKGEIAAALCPLDELVAGDPATRHYQVLAVGAPARLAEFPEVPTLAEVGVDLSLGHWTVLAFPRGVSQGQAQDLWSILYKPENQEAICRGMSEHGIRPDILGPEATADLWRAQARIAQEIGRETGYWRADRQWVSLYKVLAVLALFTTFMLLAPLISYLPASLCFVLLLSLILWPGPLKRALPLIALVSLGSCVAVYLVFTQAFMVVFP